ncbi:PAS domain-containing protein [Marinimicrobium sp. C6131]|uniref:PAS domain-containing protein n=1 Tax=Marinimicrobium sp. C6131 TaxID=3022676 RepID=UPI00223E0FE0|nr:PAS domain-containing protein [Marinimicrobium sp. C6131]UZJ45221.1 PAS domain-containing protein [Marinimicrobium sp. C6131]
MKISVNQRDQTGTRRNTSKYRQISVAAFLLIFAADIVTPLGIAHGILYLLVIALANQTQDRGWVLNIGLWSLLLCSAGLVLADLPEGFPLVAVLVNRLLSLLAISVTLTISLRWLATRQAQDDTRRQLESCQRRLQQAQATLDMLSHQAGIGYWCYDKASQTFHRSELINPIVGLSAGEPPPADGALSFFPEPGRTQVVAAFDECVERGKPYTQQLPLITRSGQQRLVQTSGRPLFDHHGIQIGVVGTLEDLTGTTHSNNRFADNARALQAQLDALPVTVWSALSDGSIDYFNQALSDYSGVPRETLSAPGEWLMLLHPDDQERCVQTWTQCIQTGRPYSIQFRIRRYDGQYRWHQVQATPARDINGNIIKWYGSAVEIPESAVTV